MGEAYDKMRYAVELKKFDDAIAWHKTPEARKMYGPENQAYLDDWKRRREDFIQDWKNSAKI